MSAGAFGKTNPTSNILIHLDINPRIISVAHRAGCVSAWSILCTSQSELQQRTGLSGADIEMLITAVVNHILPKQVSSLEMLKECKSLPSHITTGCCQLDQFLGGGIPICGITEISGESGSGKTQLTLQLALNAQLPTNIGGLSKGVAYICTESQFSAVRLQQLICHMQEKYPQGPKCYTDRIFIRHVPDMDNLVDCVRYQLPLLTSQHQVGLVIIDSVAAVFRAEDGTDVNKTLTLQKLGYRLHQLASLNNIAIVTINQVAASINNKNLYGSNSDVTPALGLAWANLITTRIMLSRTASYITAFQSIPVIQNKRNVLDVNSRNQHHNKKTLRQVKYRVRTLEVTFCPWLSRKSTSFLVTNNGLEDINLDDTNIQVSHDT